MVRLSYLEFLIMDTAITSPVIELLHLENIAYDVIEIPLTDDKKPVRNLEEFLLKQAIDPQSVVRSVVFKTASDQFVLLALAGGGRADWGVLRKYLNERKCRMAEFEEVSEATGYAVGAIPPIALPSHIRVLVDNSVKAYETVVIGSGILGFALSLKTTDLLQLFGKADYGIFTA